MYILTVKGLLNSVVRRWKEAYRGSSQEDKRQKGIELSRLQDEGNLTVASVGQVIGNTTWTDLKCDSCDESFNEIVGFEVGGRYPTQLCQSCLTKALNLFEV